MARKKVIILATGGTIAGVGEKNKSTGYISGQITARELVCSIPSILELADIETEQICNINSDDITGKIWIKIARRINELAKKSDISGIVVTHGTDTLEETAYFLNLTVKTKKPIVFTGAMRPATAFSADGNMNLYQAVAVAACRESVGRGILVVFSDRIFAAGDVIKSSTYLTGAITGGENGLVGIIRDRNIFYFSKTERLHTVDSEFSAEGLTFLPNVNVIYFHTDANPQILKYAADLSDGIVIAGAGEGQFSKGFIDVINGIEKPVVISSRINSGIITEESLLCSNTISAGILTPQKAAVLLRLALTKTKDINEVSRMFKIY